MFKKLKIKEITQLEEIRRSAYLIKKNPATLAGIIIIIILIFAAILAPYLAPYPSHALGAVDPENKFLPPSSKYLFGTDELGRDIFSRILFGARISFKIAAIAVGLALLIGVPLGVIAGFLGSKIDEAIMRVTDIFLSFPPLLLALAICAALGPSITNTMIAIAVSWWPWYTRLVRGQAVSVKERPFVEAARAIGVSKLKIAFRHILPNCLAPTIIQASMDLGAVILTAAGLSFLGLGAQPPQPEWGLMCSTGRMYLFTSWWSATFPGLAILIIVLGFNLVGDGFREILDPRTRRLLR